MVSSCYYLILVLQLLQWNHCYSFNLLGGVGENVGGRTSTFLFMQKPMTSLSPLLINSPELGGDIIRIRTGPDDDDDEDGGFLTTMGVPTFAVIDSSSPHSDSGETSTNTISTSISNNNNVNKPKRLGLEGILGNSNAFVLQHALSAEVCESIISTCEELRFGTYNAGKNNHGAQQIVISKPVADSLLTIIGPHINLEGVVDADRELRNEEEEDDDNGTKTSFALTGINRRFRIYRYAPDMNERFAPHIDAGFPPGGVSLDDDNSNHHDNDGTTPFLHWDASHQYSTTSEVVSRLTVLIYLNEDFNGGHTKFYEPFSERGDDCNNDGEVIASIKPRTGSILVFPQAIGEEAVERAREIWPQHEGSPVTSGNRPKYVIRTDVLFETIVNDEMNNLPKEEKVLFQHDDAVRTAFLPTSPMFSSLFTSHVQPLYNPHMGVENAGPLLYSLVRFTKCRKIVEVGAGYTTLFLLQALKDNDDEMKRVVDLNNEGRLRMLDYPFGTPRLDEWASLSPSNPSLKSSLLCIDNCDHQKETASGAVGVAHVLGLESYLEFLKGDAFDALDTHFSEVESIDLLWCDFGVGSRMKEYSSSVWKFIKPGGLLVCHSTLTNKRTREWLEGVRQGKGEDITGIPANEYAELSFLEPHKRFQNSVSILQKRVGTEVEYSEPIYSEYA